MQLESNEILWPRIVQEQEIKDYMLKYASGQKEAIELLSFIGHAYTLMLFGLKCGIRRNSMPKMNALFTGPTGFGKSFLIRKFAESLSLPYKKIDCTSVSAEGWKGTSLSSFLSEFLSFSPSGFGIIHLDEIDKIGLGRIEGAVSGQEHKMQMQMSLLDLMDGDYHYFPDPTFNKTNANFAMVNNSLVILSGSFQSHRNEKKDKKYLGFKHTKDPEETRSWKERLIELGFAQEFAGRIVTSIELEKYTDEEIKNIILNTKESAYTKYKNIYLGNATLENEVIEAMVKKISSSKTGLRELDTLMFEQMYNKRPK